MSRRLLARLALAAATLPLAVFAACCVAWWDCCPHHDLDDAA